MGSEILAFNFVVSASGLFLIFQNNIFTYINLQYFEKICKMNIASQNNKEYLRALHIFKTK